MKKFTLVAASMLAVASMGAQTIGNPVDKSVTADKPHYIVAYDMVKGDWCASNAELDETFVFAIDFTGTDLEKAMKELPSPNRGNILGRSGAFDIFTMQSYDAANPDAGTNIDGRLFPIDRDKNIYGMTINFFQHFQARLKDAPFGPDAAYENYLALAAGETFTFGDNVFAFGWSATNPGAEWWNAVGAPVQDVLVFTTAPYTGTKTGHEFTYADLHEGETECPFEGLDYNSFMGVDATANAGYARPSDFAAIAGVSTIAVDDVAEVVSYEYFDLMGRRVNGLQEQGVTIRRANLANGKARVEKIAR